MRSGRPGNALQRLQAGDLLLRRQGARLQLEAAEAVLVHHHPRFAHELFFVQHLAPAIRRIRIADVLRVLVEQVGAVRHLAPHRPAEQLHQRDAQVARLQVEEGHLQRGVDLFDIAQRVRPRR
jgi:hypothetical protein